MPRKKQYKSGDRVELTTLSLYDFDNMDLTSIIDQLHDYINIYSNDFDRIKLELDYYAEYGYGGYTGNQMPQYKVIGYKK